jgi:sugar/nucleoside kinase (ribokinase family)
MHHIGLVGGFVTAVLHGSQRRAAELASVERQASWLAAIGAGVLVLAAATGATGYAGGSAIDDDAWSALFASLDEVAAIARSQRLELAVHLHWGTVIEKAAHVDRFLAGCRHGLCLDTGHLALGGSDPLDVARRAGERVRHVHLKDVDAPLAAGIRAGTLDYAAAVRRGLYRALGDGAAHIGELLTMLREAGYAGWYVLEQDAILEIRADELDLEGIAQAALFWTTGTGLSADPSRTATLVALDAARGTRVPDLDHRPDLWPAGADPRAWAQEAIRRASVVVGDLDEVEMATGERDPDRAATALLTLGPDLVVVKLGPDGALARTRQERATAPAIPVDVVCGLGAGDAFGAALCHGLLARWDLARTLRSANAAGAIAASRLACADAMPTADEVEELLRVDA